MTESDRRRWNARWLDHQSDSDSGSESGSSGGAGHGSALFDLVEPWLPNSGRLLDVAGGGSRASLEFARAGLDVTVADLSEVGLSMATEQARAENLAIFTLEINLEEEPLPSGPWDVITVANYLQRDLFPQMIAALVPGGILGAVIVTKTNLERNDRPGAHFSADADELPALVAGLEIVHYTSDWRPNNRHEAHLVARKPPATTETWAHR